MKIQLRKQVEATGDFAENRLRAPVKVGVFFVFFFVCVWDFIMGIRSV